MQGVILAAGKGSRLHPITTSRSKAMLPILGQPIVERAMEGLWDNGVDAFVLVVSPDDADIVSYFAQESPLGEYELQDAIQMLIDSGGRVCGIVADSRLTRTDADDLLAINSHYLSNGDQRLHLAPYTVGPNTQLITPLRIEPGTTIGADCVIGPRAYIEQDCTVGSGAVIRDAVVLRGAVVPSGSTIERQVVS